MIIIKDDDVKIKKAHTTAECQEMLREALKYIRKNSKEQAKLMLLKFKKIKSLIEILPEMGTIYKKDLRRFKLGKFRYNMYYRIKEESIQIVGIWHTSRGTEFEE